MPKFQGVIHTDPKTFVMGILKSKRKDSEKEKGTQEVMADPFDRSWAEGLESGD